MEAAKKICESINDEEYELKNEAGEPLQKGSTMLMLLSLLERSENERNRLMQEVERLNSEKEKMKDVIAILSSGIEQNAKIFSSIV